MAYRNTEIVIGHEGEKGFRTIEFDVSMFPEEGTVYLDYMRYGDTRPYPINLERKGNKAYWTPNEIDTAYRKTGRGQLVCIIGDDVVGKSDVFKVINRFSLDTDTDVPDAYEHWLDRLEQIATGVTEGVESGKQEITDTKDSAVSEVETKRTEAVSEVELKRSEAVSEVESKRTEAVESINTVGGEALSDINTAKTEAVNTVNSAKNDGINRLNDRIESGKAEIDTAKTTALSSIEQKKDAVHTELDGYVEAHHDELKGDKGDAYVVTEEDLKEIGDRVEAEYEPQLNALKEEVSHKAEATDLATANRKIKALTDVLNGKELAFETNEYNSAKVDVPSGAVADSVLKIGGKSVVWNQLSKLKKTDAINDITCPYNLSPSEYIADSGRFTIPNGHKALLLSIKSVNDGLRFAAAGDVPYVNVKDFTQRYARIITGTGVPSWVNYKNDGTESASGTLTFIVCDLTQMFGSGNEPTDVTDPRIDMIEQYALSRPYQNLGEIVSSQTDAVSVRGRNLIDPSKITRVVLNDNNSIVATSNGEILGTLEYIEVEPNGVYAWTTSKSGVYIIEYDTSKNFLARIDVAPNTPITMPNNCRYIRIVTWLSYGTTYLNDICFARGDGTYKPYSLTSIPTNLPQMKSAGKAHDEVEYNVTFKNMKSIELGGLNWLPSSLVANSYYYQLDSLDYVFASNVKAVCKEYSYVGTGESTAQTVSSDMTVALFWTAGTTPTRAIYIHDDSCRSASELKAKLQGVILRYESTEGGEDYTTNILHERVGSVDLGTPSYLKDAYGFKFGLKDRNTINGGSGNELGKIGYITALDVSYNFDLNADKTIAFNNVGYSCWIKYDSYDSVDAFKNAMSGVMLYYELATERIKELPNLPSLEAINVESGGEITFIDHSELAMPIPTTHEWVVRNEEV